MDLHVGTSDNVNKVTGGLVVQDNEGNQFVWIPVGDFKGKNGEIDHITLGRYKTFGENPELVQDAEEYENGVPIGYSGQVGESAEWETWEGMILAKDLKSFVLNTKENGGYYIGRFEASQGQDGKAKVKYDKEVWNNITKEQASTNAINVKTTGSYVSDLVNSYAFDTAFIFISKCSGNVNYGMERGITGTSNSNTGRIGDKACNIFDLNSNAVEWSTEVHSMLSERGVVRGGSWDSFKPPYWRIRVSSQTEFFAEHLGFRVLLY